jgi:hypothetical protein
LKEAGFGDLELATDVLGYQSSTIAASVLPSKEIVTNGVKSKPLCILAVDSIKEEPVFQKFSSDLLVSFDQAGFSPSFASWENLTVEASTVYVILDDLAHP